MTSAIGKWHLTPDNQQGSAGPFNRWPSGSGSTTTGASSGGEAGQYDPLSPRTRRSRACPRGRTASPTTSRTTWPRRRSTGSTAFAPSSRDPWFMYYATGCSHAPHHVPRGVVGQVQGQVRRGLGRRSRGDAGPPEGARRRSRRHGAAGERRVPEVGLADGDREAPVRARWRRTPATPRTPTGTWAASSTRSRRWASSTTR